MGVGVAVLAGTSLAMQSYSAYREQEAANQAAEYNARIAENNALIAGMQATEARKRGEIAAAEKRREVSHLIGAQRAAFGGSGALVDVGSPLDVITTTAAEGELDAMTIRRNAAMQGWGYEAQAQDYRSQAGLSRMRKASPFMAGATTLLTGASSMGMTYYGAGGGTENMGGTKTGVPPVPRRKPTFR